MHFCNPFTNLNTFIFTLSFSMKILFKLSIRILQNLLNMLFMLNTPLYKQNPEYISVVPPQFLWILITYLLFSD